MEKKTYESLRSRLDAEIMRLESSFPTQSEARPHASGLLLYPNMDISTIPQDKLALAHSMLHMFYMNKSGKGLRPKDIENLHKEVVERLQSHQNFDRLDETL